MEIDLAFFAQRIAMLAILGGFIGGLSTNKTLTINGISLGAWSSVGSSSQANSSVSAVIPNGSTYSVGGTASGLISWTELR